jgi:ABC-type amino acid transport substrate-binding protein
MWLVSRNEASLAGSWELLTKEELAWGIRRQDADLLNRVNGVLARWKRDGSLEAVPLKWLSYRRRSQAGVGPRVGQ